MHICKYCGNSFNSKRTLNIHIKTAIYCLKLRGQSEITCNDNICIECNKNFSRKDSLLIHQKKCIESIESIESKKEIINNSINNINNNLIINENNNNINNNINVNIYTMTDLSPARIIQELTPIFTREIAQGGIEVMTDLFICQFLQKDGSYIYWCSDKQRKKFKMLIKDLEGNVKEISDNNAEMARNLMCGSFIPLIIKVDEGCEFVDVIEKINDNKQLQDSLSEQLPSTRDGVPEEMKKTMEECEILKQNALEEYIERMKKIKNTKVIKDKKDNYNNFIKGFTTSTKYLYDKYYGDVYVHMDNGYLIFLKDDKIPVIIGHRGSTKDKINRLTKQQIKYIYDIHLENYLEPSYRT